MFDSTGTLNNANPSAALVPESMPCIFRTVFDLTNIAVAADDFTIEVKTGAAAAEKTVAWFNVTSTGAARSIDYGDGVPAVVEFEKLDVGPFLISFGYQAKLVLTRNSADDRDVPYEVAAC